MMCDTALDRSGRTRPEPKVHTDEDVRPEDKLAFRNEPVKEKPASSIIQALIRIELGRKKIQESGGRVPNVRPGHVFGLVAFLILAFAGFWVSPPFGFFVLSALCLILILPLRGIGACFSRHRVITAVLVLLFLAAWGGYSFIPKRAIKKWWRSSSLRTAVLQGPQWFSRGDSIKRTESVLQEGPFYFVQEFSWPGAEKVKYLWPLKDQEECEDFLRRKADGVSGPSIAEKCVPDEGQFEGYFLREADSDWYVTFEALGKITNVAIFTQNDRLRALGPEGTFQNIWLFAQSAQAVMEKETPAVHLIVRIFSPQGEMDATTGKLKK